MSETVDDYTAILAYRDDADLRWNAFTDVGTSVVVTYSFLDSNAIPDGTQGHFGVDDFHGFSNVQRHHMRSVIQEAGSVAGIIFVEVEDGPAMINLYSGKDTDGSGVTASGYAVYGMGLLKATHASDMVMIYQNFTPGSYTYQVLLHELGHTLGLSHPHQGEMVLDDDHDHNSNSVMTYEYSSDHQETYGVLDRQALAHLYGDADSTAGFRTKVTKDGMIIVTASARDDQLITAKEGGKILGQSGDDTLYGREGQDILRGGNGWDKLQGGLGQDHLAGQRGNDVIIGDIGDATLGHADHLIGGLGADLIFGNGGDDAIHGNAGRDTLDGGDGADLLVGGKGHDIIAGANGNDQMVGGLGRDTFVFTSHDIGDRDAIIDFRVGHDRIDLSELTQITRDNLEITQVDGDTELYSFSYALSIRLQGVAIEDLDLNDLVFSDLG